MTKSSASCDDDRVGTEFLRSPSLIHSPLLEKRGAKRGTRLEALLRAKMHSDLGQYEHKNAILRQLMMDYPEEFIVDDTEGKHHGITHLPTGFRLHTAPKVIPASVSKRMRELEISGEKTQGVGLRKTMHQRLEELGREGLAVNDARTGTVRATVPGDLIHDLMDTVNARMREKGQKDIKARGIRGTTRFRKVKVTPEQMEKFVRGQGFDMLGATTPDVQRQWLVDRYRLSDEGGNLVGRIPELARKQLKAEEPVYEKQLSHPEQYVEYRGGPAAWDVEEETDS